MKMQEGLEETYKKYRSGEGMKVDLLSCFFKHVLRFPDYLKRIIPNFTDDEIRTLFENPILLSLKDSIVTCNLDEIPTIARSKVAVGEDDVYDLMHEIISRSQSKIIKDQKTTFSTNMLTLGYRKADDRSTVMKIIDDHCITNFHVNACVTQFLMGKEWHLLLSNIGELAMEHILTNTAIFVPLLPPAQSNLLQVLGQSIGELKLLESDQNNQQHSVQMKSKKRKRSKTKDYKDEEDTKIKRLRTESGQKMETSSISSQLVCYPPAQIDFLRSRIFYAKMLRTRTGRISHGLPTKHILQITFSERFIPENDFKSEGESKTSMQEAVMKIRVNILCKHIWPREHGLPNVFFHFGNKSNDQSTKEFERRMALNNREEEVRIRGPMKTPKRLLKCKHLLKLMITKHDKFDYRRALDLCCPSPLPKRSLTKSEKEEIVAELSGTQKTRAAEDQGQNFETQIETQAPLNLPEECMTGIETFTQNCKISMEEMKKSQKPRYAKYKSPHGCVARFARLVFRSIIPIELFGSYHNRKIVLDTIDQFIRLRRFESMTLHQISQSFRLLDCEWLIQNNKIVQNQRPTREEMIKRQNLINEFLFWLFDGILIPLLKTNFYITESAKFRNHVFYFRSDVWLKITQPIVESLKQDRFEKIGKHKAVGIMSRRSFGYSFIRLLPKEVGMRPIMNLRRRSTKIDRNAKSKNLQKKIKKSEGTSNATAKRKATEGKPSDDWGELVVQNLSINNILNTAFQVLNFERQDQPKFLGSSVFGPQDVFTRLTSFKKQLQIKYDNSLPKLYFVKMDVAGAFDCIDQKKLLEIVKEIIRHDRYIVQRFNKLTSSNDQPFLAWSKKACAEEDHEPFTLLAQHLAEMQAWRNTIVSDSVVYPHCDKKSMIWLLNEHINNNLIKIGKDFCLQRIGIPQGSSLSTLLCCFYLAKMEEELTLSGQNVGESLLMRYTDDFLFISTDVKLARKFFSSLIQGSARFNCSIATEKTECNFVLYDAQMTSSLARAALSVKTVQTNAFPWCSYRINTDSLSVQYDLERYRGACVSDSLTIPTRNAFGNAIARTIAQSVQRQNLPIYLDLSLNSIKIVLRNIHQMYLVGSLKFVSILQIMKISSKLTTKRTDNYLFDSILTNIEHTYAHAKAKLARTHSQEVYKGCNNHSNEEIWPIPILVYRWIAMHAIISIFALRPSTNKMTVVSLLKERMREIQLQINKKSKRSKGESFPLSTLKSEASASFKQAKSILYSIKFVRQ